MGPPTRWDDRFLGWSLAVIGGLGLLYLASVQAGWMRDLHSNPRPAGMRWAIVFSMFAFGVARLVRGYRAR